MLAWLVSWLVWFGLIVRSSRFKHGERFVFVRAFFHRFVFYWTLRLARQSALRFRISSPALPPSLPLTSLFPLPLVSLLLLLLLLLLSLLFSSSSSPTSFASSFSSSSSSCFTFVFVFFLFFVGKDQKEKVWFVYFLFYLFLFFFMFFAFLFFSPSRLPPSFPSSSPSPYSFFSVAVVVLSQKPLLRRRDQKSHLKNTIYRGFQTRVIFLVHVM